MSLFVCVFQSVRVREDRASKKRMGRPYFLRSSQHSIASHNVYRIEDGEVKEGRETGSTSVFGPHRKPDHLGLSVMALIIPKRPCLCQVDDHKSENGSAKDVWELDA